jgi:hypothetical protein
MGTRRARGAQKPVVSRQHRLRSTRRGVASASGAGTRGGKGQGADGHLGGRAFSPILRGDGLDPAWPEKEQKRVR